MHLQKYRVLHRDIKCANILISPDGTLKLCDFGLARVVQQVSKAENLTPRVVTRWYRAPELLLLDNYYLYGIDIWSAGCVLAELMTRLPLFNGRDDNDTLKMICQSLQTEKLDQVTLKGVLKQTRELQLRQIVQAGSQTPGSV